MNFSKQDLPSLFLRIGLAFVFAFAAISSLLNPSEWVGYLPKMATQYVAADTLLKIMSVYELALAAWLLIGVKTRYAAILCALTLGGIAAANYNLFIISFRDVGLIFASLALASFKRDDDM